MTYYHRLPCIHLDWQEVNKDLAKWANDIDYIQTIVDSDTEFSKSWQDNLAKITQGYAEFGYTKHNTKIWKSTNKQSPIIFDWQDHLLQQLPLDHAIVTLTRQDPGQVLPWHYDRHFMIKNLYPGDDRKILRILVFMEDWKIGHVLQIQDQLLYDWKRGEAVTWHPDVYHIAANIGLEKKWTCNITGFLTDDRLAQILNM